MKYPILLLLLALGLVGFSSCVKEEYEECPGYLRFTFVHEGSTQEYDGKIGNDVYLRIYKDNVLYSAGRIPYDKIKGGKEYLVQKEFTGEVDVVA
ncbi:MAG: hypothetical protein LUD15_02565 [Bacteroides sp.]|nr:hypothetical protein [Bacteroides sp.]